MKKMKRRKTIIFTLILLGNIFLYGNFSQTVYASVKSVPEIEWQMCIGGSHDDSYGASTVTRDGGIILSRSEYIVLEFADNSPAKTELHRSVIKYNNLNKIEWETKFDDTPSRIINDIYQTKDDGYVLCGNTFLRTDRLPQADCWFAKLSKDGKIEWEVTYGGNDWFEEANGIVESEDGGYITLGTVSEGKDVIGNHGELDLWLLKLDQYGNIVWQKCLGGSNYDYGEDIKASTDGGYIILGETHSLDGDIKTRHINNIQNAGDVWVIKVDKEGNIIWEKTYGGSFHEVANSIEQTNDGGYIFAAETDSNNDGDVVGYHRDNGLNKDIEIQENDGWVVKLDDKGLIEWSKTLGGSNAIYDDRLTDIIQTIDGGYIAVGEITSRDGDVTNRRGNGVDSDVWLVKLDSRGNLLWNKCMGGTGFEEGYDIYQNDDGYYKVVAETSSKDMDVKGLHGSGDIWLLEIAPDTSDKEAAASRLHKEESAIIKEVIKATPTSSKVLVDGNELEITAYNINDNNYFKLRDIAQVINGTTKQFDIGWDGQVNAISLTSNKTYNPVGGELSVTGDNLEKTAYPTSSTIYLNGEVVNLVVYNIGGNNYFKLRDIAATMNFGITWMKVLTLLVLIHQFHIIKWLSNSSSDMYESVTAPQKVL